MKIKRKIGKMLGGILIASILCTGPVQLVAASGKVEISNVYSENIGTYGASTSKKSKTTQKTVVFYYRDGSIYKTVKTRNGKVKLPYMANPSGYTFLGWSEKKGRKKNPKYEAGDVISVNKNTDFYPVIFNRSAEPNLSKRDMAVPTQYKHIIFVGDSRTYALEQFLNQKYGKSAFKKVEFIGKPGSNLNWLKKTGSKRLKKLLEKNKKNGEYEKTAIIFNHGVNNVKHTNGDINIKTLIQNYCSYMRELATILEEKNCDLYYMSVNPINAGTKSAPEKRKGEEIRQFNNGIKNGLKGLYDYIDTYHYLVKNGYGTAHRLDAQDRDDGTHYTYKTYKRIFAYCLRHLSKK